jgi:bacterioferritin-associated ferredoxin
MVGHDAARDAVLSGKVTTYAEFKRNSPAGSNCTLCDPYFERIISMYLMVRGEPAASVAPSDRSGPPEVGKPAGHTHHESFGN